MPAKMGEPMEVPFGTLTRVHLKNHVLDGGRDSSCNGQFWGLSGPLKSIRNQCCGGLCSKKSITVTAELKQPAAMLQTGWCHITLPPCKNLSTCNANFHHVCLLPFPRYFHVFSVHDSQCP